MDMLNAFEWNSIHDALVFCNVIFVYSMFFKKSFFFFIKPQHPLLHPQKLSSSNACMYIHRLLMLRICCSFI